VGPKPLSRERILQAAFSQADRFGLDKVTMRGVAAKLNVEAMSLYHHVPNKQAMLDGLVDMLVRQSGLPIGDVTPAEWIQGFARSMRTLAQQHPRLLPLLTTRSVPLDDPLSALPFEAGLNAFAQTGRSPKEGFAALQATAVALLAMAQLEAASVLQADAAASGLDALPVDDFPLVHQALNDPAGLDEIWDTLVTALVRGLDGSA
jgi:TetR/AcrR family tetracycline transcriptional repressor